MFEDLILALALQQCMQNAVPHQMYYIFFASKSQQKQHGDKRRWQIWFVWVSEA